MGNIFLILGEKIGVPKSVVWGLLTTIVIGSSGWTYAFVAATSKTNAEAPLIQNQLTQVQRSVTSLTIGQEVMKTNAANTNGKVDDIYKKIDKLTDLTIQILTNSKIIKNNTTDK